MNALQVPASQGHSIQDTAKGFIDYLDRSNNTARAYTINLRQFIAWLKYNRITEPTRATIIEYKNWLQEEHPAIILDATQPEGWNYRTDAKGQQVYIKCKSNTIAQYIRAVAMLFKWAASAGIYPNIADNIHTPKTTNTERHKKDRLTPAEVNKVEVMLQAQATDERGKRDLAMYMLAVNNGLRTIEINRANVEDIEYKEGNASIYIYGKGHTEADTKRPIAPAVYCVIKEYLNSRTDKPTGKSPLFVSTGNRAGGQRIARTTISTMLKNILKDAGIDSAKITPHSLRHTAGCSIMEITGRNIYETQQYMRHENPATTEIYIHELSQEEEKRAELAARLYAYYHGEENTEAEGNRQKLYGYIARMNPSQLSQLEKIAAAILK